MDKDPYKKKYLKYKSKYEKLKQKGGMFRLNANGTFTPIRQRVVVRQQPS